MGDPPADLGVAGIDRVGAGLDLGRIAGRRGLGQDAGWRPAGPAGRRRESTSRVSPAEQTAERDSLRRSSPVDPFTAPVEPAIRNPMVARTETFRGGLDDVRAFCTSSISAR